MSRLPAVSRDSLAPEGQEVWDRIAAVRGAVRGPFGVLIHAPALAGRVAALEDYFRYEAELPAADRELVILATGRETGARYSWVRHEPHAREAGTRPEAIEAVRANGPLDGLTPRERLLVEIVRSLFRAHTLPEDLFARARAELGDKPLVEAVTLAGHYSLVGFVLNGFAVPPPDDSPSF
jgi:4-carboxymuconolactone decarboxylase